MLSSVYWEFLKKNGTSNLGQQKKVIALVLRLLRSYPIVLLGDREFQSVQLAKWLQDKGVDFALRQKKNTCISDDRTVYVVLKNLEIKPGMSRFYEGICCTKAHQVGDFNLAAYWKRKYRGKGPKDTCYILTSLQNIKLTFPPESPHWGDIGGGN